MAIIGKIIKQAIHLSDAIGTEADPVKEQNRVLGKLLEKAQLTAFGKQYDFQKILTHKSLIQAFQQAVPIFDYDKLYAEWWHYLLAGHQNVTWPGGQSYFAISSGTTSNSKYIPVTEDMLEAIRRAGIQQITSLKNFDLPPTFFEKQILMLGSSTNLIQKDDHLEGEISGISAANIPFWFRKFYKPGSEIASLDNWEQKIRQIAERAPEWDIGSITGIPSWTELMLKEIISFNKLNTIHDVWPNLAVYTSGGVAFEPYRKSFEKLVAKPLVYIDTYLASEGYLATQKRPDADMALITDNGVFFEFVPFTEANMEKDGTIKPQAQVLSIAEVEENVNYVLLISTVAGAWRYMIGDTVMVTNKERMEIKISGRTKHYLNVVGEQLSVYQMNEAMRLVEREFNTTIEEFTVAALVNDGDYKNRWILGTTNLSADATKVADYLDNQLRALNKNYDVARNKALKSVEVKLVPINHFYEWSAQTKKLGGQVKIPRVMKDNEFLALEKFLNALG
ncbi:MULTISPECIES: GH3 family domain-containing protein [Olivibacter]|uniref:GH3 auxin-responsive promoter family protein n=1 Tax=Olivibacter jilunii TaxID=985016 RepID=A0ABW6B383_9SPHI|nr:GH3 auxin-responsive promoter family protein [Olivibacter sp. UJ_SKK_5.1]MDX3914700.1 GH3 auxin-responsive promoter family protein [Pseudosphingobacterium sp.]